MNNMSKKILLAALAVGSSHLYGATGKTYLTSRSTGVNLAMEKTAGWHHLIECDDKKRFGFNLQAVGFYNDYSDNQGRYFLVNNKDTVHVTETTGAVAPVDINLNTIIHDNATTKTGDLGTLNLKPEQKTYGVNFYYHQDLDKLLKGLYFSVGLPIVHVQNKLNIKTSGTVATDADFSLINYFSGQQLGAHAAASADAQNPLTNALIVKDDTKTGVADIDVRFGFDFLRLIKKDGFRAAINLGFTIPTSSSSDGKKVFEAREGNQDHWGLGFGLDADLRIWGDRDHGVKLYTALDYRYLFEDSEKRTYAFNKITGAEEYTGDFSQYTALAVVGDKAVTPAANYTTLNTDVTPGSQVDFVAAFAYHNSGFSVDFGYNLFFREEESLKLKDTLTANLGIPKFDADMTTAFALADGVITRALTNADLNVTSATTPSVTSHKVYGGVAYVAKQFEIPFLVGLGAHYEFRGGNNSALQGWGINGRLGVGF